MYKVLLASLVTVLFSTYSYGQSTLKKDNMNIDKFMLAGHVNYNDAAFTNKVIFTGDSYKIILFALKAGQEVKPHSTPVNAFLTILEGEGKIKIGETVYTLKQGESILLPKDIPHHIWSHQAFKMMLIK